MKNELLSNDLTTGTIWKKMLAYFLPLAAGTVFQQLYNAADGLIVGKYVGTIALAAVGGSAALVSNALVNFFVGLTGGGSILIAQFFGANNKNNLKKSVSTSMIFAFFCGIAISIACFLLTSNILVWMKNPAECMEDSIIYLRIVFCGLMFQLVYNMSAGILRAIGDSRTPFITLSVSCTINIALDLLFVKVFAWGVAGAAYATIISQLVCALLTTSKLIKYRAESYGLNLKELCFDWNILKKSLAVGVPLAFQTMMYAVTNILIQVSINVLGTVDVAAWAITGKLDGFFWGFMSAANATVTNFIGQNYGKGDYDRMKKGVYASFAIFMILGVAYSVSLVAFSNQLIPLFSDDPAVFLVSKKVINIIGPFYWVWVFNEIFSGALRGEGKTLISFIIIAISICGFRLAWLATLFAAKSTIEMLSICYPASWAVASCGMAIYYIIHMRRKAVVQ
ncbi:MAG: MATE family efflux transporter [Bacillota bacterium]|nr:MATE family efflux transporter [Bacillota bacterium]